MTPLDVLPWALSVQTLGAMWIAGHNPRVGWFFALVGQTTWTGYTFAAHAWGFIPLNVGLTIVYYRNWRLCK
jgi:hypothetical protein